MKDEAQAALTQDELGQTRVLSRVEHLKDFFL